MNTLKTTSLALLACLSLQMWAGTSEDIDERLKKISETIHNKIPSLQQRDQRPTAVFGVSAILLGRGTQRFTSPIHSPAGALARIAIGAAGMYFAQDIVKKYDEFSK